MLKEKLTCAPVLVYPDFREPFVLDTDASIRGLGAVLSQQQRNGQLHPVAYASHSLLPPEKNYSVTELETLAVVWAMQHFNAYLYGHKITVITDHTAFKAILQAPHLNGKHPQRWLKVFGSRAKKLNIIYRPGRENTKANALSRNTVADPQPEQSEIGVQTTQVRSFNPAHMDISQLFNMPPQTAVVQPLLDHSKEQKKDPKLRKILDYMNKGLLPDDSQDTKKIAAQASQYAVIQNVLYFIDVGW